RMYWKKTDRTTLPGGVALGLIWIALVFHVVTSAVGIHYSDVVANVSYWASAGATVGGLSAILAGGFVSWAAYALLTRRGGRMLKRVKKQTGRWTSPRKGGMTQTEILRAMSLSPLFRIVDMQRQIEIARRFTVKRIRPLRVLASGEPSGEDEVGMIVRGTAFVAQRGENGRKRSLRRYSEGDIFGAHSLVDPLRPQIEVKSRTPVLALTLPRKFFQERIVQQLGATKVHNLTHICSFLRSLPLCRYWQLSSVIRMTEIAVSRTFEAGDKIVQFSDDPRYFYVILEGTVHVMRNGKLLHRLRVGDSFGEAELLQNSAANADVVAKTTTRCLAVSRTDFIRFVTHNHHVALSLETTSSRRLGHPIFPLQSSFDVR
ncbi:MAG TPA: cyclic nucleotide-binding domain-containing protein, partial [Opitutaceae bacterium]|nr:cyclic nucleotide-binding domain-containing protein [Opitutaceae bacterium]